MNPQMVAQGAKHARDMLPTLSTGAADTDRLFWFITIVSIVVFVIIMSCIAYFVIKYRYRPGGPKADVNIVHNTKLEVAWTLIPFLIMVGFFAWGYYGYLNKSVAPADSIDIKVIGKKWYWTFEYPQSGAVARDTLVVPVGKPIRLSMTSSDVIHSLYIVAVRLKADAVPNKYSSFWFQADKTGEYQIFCAEFCGTDHSAMLAKLVVVSQEEYEAWLKTKSQQGGTPVERGEWLFNVKWGCNSCHAVQSPEKQPTPAIGPRLYKSFGRKEKFADGSEGIVDENYIRESIVNPRARTVAGYDKNAMPVLAIEEQSIGDLIEYIKTLK